MTAVTDRPAAIVFDLDGTLIDSAPDIAGALNRVMADLGRDPLAVEYVEGFIGDGSRSMLRRILIDNGIDVDDRFLEARLSEYMAHYRAAPACRTRFFPFVKEDLAALSEAGIKLGICTNKPHQLTGLVLEALGIKDLFAAVLGADAVARRKPHADHLLAVVADLGVDAGRTVYVGDTEIDRACARSAGIPFFLVSWGGGKAMPEAAGIRISRLADLLGDRPAQAAGAP